MAKPKTDKTDEVLTTLQNLFILEALKAGMSVDDIRDTLHVNMWRVINISKALKQPDAKNSRQRRSSTGLKARE